MIHAIEALAMLFLTATNPVPETAPTLCDAQEKTVLYGQVQDDFGLDVAVCISGEDEQQAVTIHWEGEGGGSSISCDAGQCDGLIEYSRYTSPNLTILTLAWREGDHEQRLTQTISRPDMETDPTSETRHSWTPAGLAQEDALDYPVTTADDSLALMQLESVLENKDWTVPLLAGRTK